jgi:hypothetical protein
MSYKVSNRVRRGELRRASPEEKRAHKRAWIRMIRHAAKRLVALVDD